MNIKVLESTPSFIRGEWEIPGGAGELTQADIRDEIAAFTKSDDIWIFQEDGRAIQDNIPSIGCFNGRRY